ncbi:MAG: DMT family transporter [Eubacteriales bacterium]|nr:DMT family transporter [Eubacteriales bacterium]
MTWFWFSIITLLCWSGSDFFSKIGCRDAADKYSHLKMVMAVGIVMGLHAAFEVFVNGVEISWGVIWTYLPVSLLYIGSMALGYVGLRYIELSISSPICNASGALVAVIAIVSGTAEPMDWPQYLAIALACAGVIGLGFVEANEDEALRAARQEASNYKYAKSWLALALPIAYCLLDAAGTFADELVLETLNEDSANVAYELTFLAAAAVSFVYTILIKKQRLVPKMEGPKYLGAIFETAGQFTYIMALASGEAALAAPIISSYCMASVLWSRLFLKEKLSWRHYLCIAVTFAGILIMGIYDM